MIRDLKESFATMSIMAFLAGHAEAAIANNGLWTGFDWYKSDL